MDRHRPGFNALHIQPNTLQIAAGRPGGGPDRYLLAQRLAALPAGKLALPLAVKPRFVSIES